jgi:hypothetical protein
MKPRHRLVSATRRLWPTVMTIMNVILLIVVSSTSLLARVGKPDGPGIIGKARRGWEWGSAWGYWAWADLRPIRLSRFLLPPLTTRATADTRSAGRRLTFRTRGNARSRGSLNSRTSLLFYFAGERDGFLARREGIARRPLRDPALRVDA